MKPLLILACSATKRPEPHPMPAIERYDGPFYRVLRKALRERDGLAERLDVWALSAEFGLISAETPIPDYDRRMDMRRGEELRRPVAQALNQIAALNTHDRAFVSVGAVYRYALTGPLPWPVTWAHGGIGEQLGQLKRWLWAI